MEEGTTIEEDGAQHLASLAARREVPAESGISRLAGSVREFAAEVGALENGSKRPESSP